MLVSVSVTVRARVRVRVRARVRVGVRVRRHNARLSYISPSSVASRVTGVAESSK